MLAAKSPITPQPHLKTLGTGAGSGHRRPLQPKNTFLPSDEPNNNNNKPKKDTHVSISTSSNNKENFKSPVFEATMDASLAEELNAVKKKLERLRLDREKTEKVLEKRDRFLDSQLNEVLLRGEFQKELEIEVDRLYRLKQLKLACMRRSPIRSLRDKEMEKKKNKEEVFGFEGAKAVESKEEITDESSSTGSPMLSFESTASTSASTSKSASTSASSSNSISTMNSISSSRKSPIRLLLSLESA